MSTNSWMKLVNDFQKKVRYLDIIIFSCRYPEMHPYFALIIFSAFARYPNGVVVHYFCCKDPKVCPLDWYRHIPILMSFLRVICTGAGTPSPQILVCVCKKSFLVREGQIGYDVYVKKSAIRWEFTEQIWWYNCVLYWHIPLCNK